MNYRVKMSRNVVEVYNSDGSFYIQQSGSKKLFIYHGALSWVDDGRDDVRSLDLIHDGPEYFCTAPVLSFYILTNDDTVFVDIRAAAAQYNNSQLARCGLSSDLFLFQCFKVRIQVLFSRGYLSSRLGRDDWRLQVLCYGSSFLTGRHNTRMFKRL